MYSYKNSYLDNFRNNIRTGSVDNKTMQTKSGSASAGGEIEQAEIQNVVPDYNVSVPTGYSKIGIETLKNGQEIHCYKLNNGQRVYIAPMESAHTTLNTYVNTGSMNEKDDERGISHFCEHMAFNGTKGTNGYMKLNTGDVFAKVAEMGGYTNASTNFAETNYTISIPMFNKNDFETIVKMQSSMMNNLEMSEAMTEKEHGPVTSEINMYSDMADTIASNTAYKNLYNIQTTSADIVAGTVDNILNVDSKKVTDYYKNNYFPANMTTVVTGEVNPDEAIEIISKHFRGENPQNPDRRTETFNLIQSPVRKDIISNKAVGTTGVLAFNGPANNNAKDNITLSALNYLLFNKKHSITTEALDKYGAEVSATTDKIRTGAGDSSVMSLTYTTTEENSEIVLQSIYDNILNFKTPSDEDMNVLKTAMKMRYEKICDNTDRLNYMIGQSSLTGSIDECTKAVDIIDSLTGEDLVNACKKYYDLNKVSIAVVHPDKASAETINNHYTNAKNVSFTGVHKHNFNSNPIEKVPLNTGEVERLKFDNNCEAAYLKSKNDIAVISAAIVDVVPAYPKPGVLDLLEELMTNGSDEVAKIMDKNNISALSSATNKEITYSAEAPAKNVPLAMRIMKNAILNPNFSRESFERAKRNLRTELLTKEPSAIQNAQHDLFPDSPRQYTNKDILDNLDNVTIEDVMGLHQYILQNGSFLFSASLPTDKYPEVKNIVTSELGQLPKFKEYRALPFNDFSPIKKSKVITDETNTAQADVVQVYKFNTKYEPKDFAARTLMTMILARGDDTGLFNNLREKEKLAYSVGADVITASNTAGLLMCSILTTTDSPDCRSYENVQRSIEGFNRQISKMVGGEFTDRELDAMKLSLKSQLLEAASSQADKVDTVIDGMRSPYGINDLNEKYKVIDSITRDDIQQAAIEIFSNKPIYSIRASKDTLNANREFLQSLA